MLVLRILIGVGLAYLVLLLLAWLFQDRLAFPAPRAKLPDPKRLGVENGERVELVSGDGTKLVGWYLTPKSPTSAGLLWFYGNGETVAAIWPIVREFQPPGTAVLVLDYPGYGGSGGPEPESTLPEPAPFRISGGRDGGASGAGVGRGNEAGGLVSNTKAPTLRCPPLFLRQR